MFSEYLFEIPLTSKHAGSIAEALVSLFFQHSHIPTTLLSDLRTIFVARLQHELIDLLEIQLQHASLKHSQTIRVFGRSYLGLQLFLNLIRTKVVLHGFDMFT